MGMKKLYYLFIFLLGSLFLSCSTQKVDPLIYATYETRAVASENAGSYLLRVQGKGVTKKMARENALKQAVRDVIFTDVHVAYGDHKPLMRLITDPSVETKNQRFFDAFFSNDGGYLEFVRSTKSDEEHYSDGAKNTVILNVIVERAALRDYLKNEGFIK